MAKEFELGDIVATTRIVEEIPPTLFMELLVRHGSGDWGDLGEEDKEANDLAVELDNDRILSSYHTEFGKIWIITECDRSATTILFPDEY
jgi:hypothetical protein